MLPKVSIFAVSLSKHRSQDLMHGRRLYMKKAFTKRFVLTLRNFATFRYSQEQGNISYLHVFRREAYWCKHIRRGVSALLVLLYRAMRRPRSVDGRTVRTPTLYLYIIINVIYLSFGEIKDSNVQINYGNWQQISLTQTTDINRKEFIN